MSGRTNAGGLMIRTLMSMLTRRRRTGATNRVSETVRPEIRSERQPSDVENIQHVHVHVHGE